ncbi:MAG: GTPase, partial [Oscillospiraceae bacterium]
VRNTQRRRREKNAMPVVALVGYTNSGKSTLLNKLSGSDIPANNRLFDTLDTTTRRMNISDTQEILLSDTVGFIRKLPHHLVEAFKATLEELSYADILLHVIDISNPDWENQAEIVDALIEKLGAGETPQLRIFNKCDIFDGEMPHGEGVVCVSAKTGEGTEALLSKISKIIESGKQKVSLLLPYDKAALLEMLHREGAVVSADYGEEGIAVEAVIKPELWAKVKPFAKNED